MSIGPISVVESRWWDKGNHSVKSLLEAVASIHYENPSAFYYDMFAEKHSLSQTLNTRCSDKVTEVIYLASHGNKDHIGPTSDTAISRTEFRNLLISHNTSAQVKGLFLGTCLTGNVDFAKFFIEEGRTKLEWIAGYKSSVDWVDGSAIDMVFFSKLAALYVKNKRKKKKKESARGMAHEAASELVKLIPGAHSHYGFNIFFHENRKITSMFR